MQDNKGDNQHDHKSIPSEYESEGYEESIEQTTQVFESYSKIQKIIGAALPLLPTKIKDSMNSAKSELEIVARNYLKEFEGFDILNPALTNQDLSLKLQKVVELTWILAEIANNFKVDFNSLIFADGLLISVKCLSLVALTSTYPHIQSLLSQDVFSKLLKIVKNLKMLPLSTGTFPEVSKFSDEANLSKGFILYLLPFKPGHQLEINVGTKASDDFKPQLCKVLVTLKSTLFANQFEQVWGMYKEHGLNFFGVHSDLTKDFLPIFLTDKLSPVELRIVQEEFEYFINLEKKAPGLIIKMYHFFSKIPHHIFQKSDVPILREAIFRIGSEIKDQNKIDMWSGGIGKLFANLILKPSDQQGVNYGVQAIVSTIECFINEMYPFEKGDTGDSVMRGAITYFTELVTRKIDHQEYKEHRESILSVFEPLMIRVTNFGIFRESWFKLGEVLQSLCLLNKGKYSQFFLDRIKFGLEQDRISKPVLFGHLTKLAPITCEHKDLAQNIYWIVPTLLNRLKDTSDNSEIDKIFETLATHFEFFIGLSSGSGYDHLVDMKDDIEEAAFRLFKEFLKKGLDFKVNDKHLATILSIGKNLLNRCFEEFEDIFKGSCDQLDPYNIQMLISHLFQLKKDDTEELLEKWIDKHVWTKTQNPKSCSDFKLAASLEVFGIKSIEYNLRSDNENTITRQISIISSITRHGVECSQSLFEKSLKFLALCFESSEKKVVANSIAALNLYFSNFEFYLAGIPSKADVKEAIRTGDSRIKHTEFKYPYLEHSATVEKMFQSWILEPIKATERYFVEILGDTSIEEVPYSKDRVVEVYKHTIKQGDEEVPNSLIHHPAIDKMCDIISLLNGFMSTRYAIYQLVNSSNFISFFKSFKQKLFAFLLKSGLFELDKIKKTVLYLLNIEVNSLNDLMKGSCAIVRFYYQNLNYNSKISFKLMPMRTQIDFARILSVNYQRIKVLLGDRKTVSLVFDKLASKDSALFNWTTQESEEQQGNQGGYIFSGKVKEYLFDYCTDHEFMKLAPLFFNYNSNMDRYKIFLSIYQYGPFYLKEDTKDQLCEVLLDLTKINFKFDTDFYHLVNKVAKVQIALINEVGTLRRKEMLLQFLEICTKSKDKYKVVDMVKSLVKFIQHHGVYYGAETEDVKSSEVARLLTGILDLETILQQEATTLLQFFTDLVVSHKLIQHDIEFLETALQSLQSQIGDRDLTKRMILSVAITFIQQLIDEATIKISYAKIDLESFDTLGDSESTIQKIISQLKYSSGIEQENFNTDASIAQKFQDLTPDYIPLIQESANLKSSLKFKKMIVTREIAAQVESQEFETIPEIQAYKQYLSHVLPENSSLPIEAYNTLPYNPDFIFSSLAADQSLGPQTLTKNTLMFRLMTISFLKKYRFKFFEHFYHHIEKNEAKEEHENVERYKEEFIILGLRILDEHDQIFKLLEPRFGVLNTSGFMRFFFRMYWAMNNCVSFRNLKRLQDEFQSSLKHLPATRQAGYIVAVQALFYNSNFIISKSFCHELLNFIVPETIEYSNLTVYEYTANFLTSLLNSSGIYIKNLSKSATSLIENVPEKAVKFLDHLRSQNKVTQLSSLKSMFIPLMGQNLVVSEQYAPIVDGLVSTIVNIGEGENEGMEEMIQGLTGMFSRIIPSIVCDKPYLLKKLIEEFTVKGAIQNEADEGDEYMIYEPLKGTRASLIMTWIATTIQSQLRDLEENKKVPLLSVLSFLAATTASKDEGILGQSLSFVISRCSNSDLDWLVSSVSSRLSKLDNSEKNDKIITGYGSLLMYVIKSRKWELGLTAEKALEAIFAYKKKSKTLKKKFNYFISDFWKKRTSQIELSLKELSSEIKEELDDYKVPYSYFSQAEKG